MFNGAKHEIELHTFQPFDHENVHLSKLSRGDIYTGNAENVSAHKADNKHPLYVHPERNWRFPAMTLYRVKTRFTPGKSRFA